MAQNNRSHAAEKTGPGQPGSVKVWDPVVRAFHWTIVAGFAAEMFLTEEGKWLHRWIGYGIAVAILGRIIWGFIGSPHARFADFVPRPGRLKAYLVALGKGREPRYIGHNPAGAVMMLSLMGLMGAACLTGWMQGLDQFWGVEWVQELHEVCANAILVLAGAHVLAAFVESYRHRENLIWTMITGNKKRASGSDIDHANPSR